MVDALVEFIANYYFVDRLSAYFDYDVDTMPDEACKWLNSRKLFINDLRSTFNGWNFNANNTLPINNVYNAPNGMLYKAVNSNRLNMAQLSNKFNTSITKLDGNTYVVRYNNGTRQKTFNV